MAYISEEKKLEILAKATLEKILTQYHDLSKNKGVNRIADCPICGTEKKLEYNPKKDIVKCFKCGAKGAKTPVSYLMTYQGKSYKEALEELAKLELIDLPDRPPIKEARTSLDKNSFCAKMLSESGLTINDITSEVFINETTTKDIATYQAGTVDESFEIVAGDDVIIRYFDLDGKPIHFYRKSKSGHVVGRRKEFYRVRYQNPSLHPDKNGDPVKYRSPYGSGSHIYIPKAIRRKYKVSAQIETLYIQEGEKKADKATKHGLISVGVMGIHNIAYNQSLPKEFELIIKRCQVKNVVFVLDSDWQDLSSKIDSKHAADQRPKSFYAAVNNFQKHFYAFSNIDIYLNIFFAHVKPNPEKDKGIDDLLTNSLRGKEKKLKDLCEKAIIEPAGDATWVQFHNITTANPYKLMEFWGLQNKDAFVTKHKEALLAVPEFKFGKMKWRFDKNGQIELAQPLLDHEQYWNVDEKTNAKGQVTNTTYSFNHKRCYDFLQSRGYGRLEQPNNNYMWIRMEDSTIRQVEVHQIRDFVINFTKQLNMENVENMLYRGGPKYFGPDSMGNLNYVNPVFHTAAKGLQFLYFKDSYWKITKEDIEVNKLKNLEGAVWKDQIKDFAPKKTNLMLNNIHQVNDDDIKDDQDLKLFKGEWTFEFSDEGMNCHFLQFLLNTSIFDRKPGQQLEDLSLANKLEASRHFLSKVTAMGYMLHRYRDSGLLKAVIGMDGKMSEVGTSNGRSGKSLIGEAIRKLIPTAYIGGKKKDLTDDRFKWEEVDERTQNVFIDDVRPNFDFEAVFPEITGDFQIEGKGIKRYTLAREVSPKIYITTNHALRGEGGSFRDRQILLGFSDHYNDKHKPIDDFKTLFFDEWDHYQWNLFYNMAAMCLHLYFKYGLIDAPTEKLEKRRLRQEIGEAFLDWAEEYFNNAYNLRNRKLEKSTMFNEESIQSGKGYLVKFPREKLYTNINRFKKKLRQYCQFQGWEFNPSKKGGDIKSAGKEYIEIYPPDDVYNRLNTQKSLEFAD